MDKEKEIDYEAAWNDLYNFITEGNSYIDDTSKAVLLVVEHQMRRLLYKHTKED